MGFPFVCVGAIAGIVVAVVVVTLLIVLAAAAVVWWILKGEKMELYGRPTPELGAAEAEERPARAVSVQYDLVNFQ